MTEAVLQPRVPHQNDLGRSLFRSAPGPARTPGPSGPGGMLKLSPGLRADRFMSLTLTLWEGRLVAVSVWQMRSGGPGRG